MTAASVAWQAVLGWRDLLARNGGWEARFTLSRRGLIWALAFYGAVIVLNIAVQLIGAELVSVFAIFANVAINVLPVLGLMVAIVVSVLALRLQASLYGLLVPAVYALALSLLVGLALSFVQAPVGPVLLGVLGFMMFRLGGAAAGLDLKLGIAFALFCVVAVIAMPLILYTAIAPGPGPI